jgi:hypothetical protein
MKVIFLVVALLLIGASVAAFLFSGGPAVEGPHRFFVSGQLRGEVADKPWAGTFAQLGTDNVILGEDGAFKFAVLPGRYRLFVCCSPRFQGINKEVVVEKADVSLDLEVTPLTEIKGQLAIQGGTQVPYGYLISAALAGSNIVDHAETDVDGSFKFHLMQGDWEIRMDNMPPQFKIVSIKLGEEKVADRKFTLAKGAPSLPLQIALQ